MSTDQNEQNGPLLSHAAAVAAGLPTYFTGRPCKNGHISQRRVHSCCCIACNKERALRWHAAHREDVLARLKAMYYSDLERIRERRKIRYAANRSQAIADAASWKKANPVRVAASNKKNWHRHLERHRINEVKRRARKRGAGGAFTKDDLGRLLVIQKRRCAHCAKSLRAGYHIDHIMPLYLGGAHDRGNIQLLCVPCNLSKGSRDPITFARKAGRLL